MPYKQENAEYSGNVLKFVDVCDIIITYLGAVMLQRGALPAPKILYENKVSLLA